MARSSGRTYRGLSDTVTMKSFDTSTRRGRSAVVNPAAVTFVWDGTEMTAEAPSSGQLALLIAEQSDPGPGAVRAMFDFLGSVLGAEDWATIEDSLREGVDVEVVVELIQHLITQWGTAPSPNGALATPAKARPRARAR